MSEIARGATLKKLADAYSMGDLSTGTLERRIEAALRASQTSDLRSCLWDLVANTRWPRSWHRRNRALPRSLILHDDDKSVRIVMPARAGSLVIGRDMSCEILVQNTATSRRHAVISRRGELCRIRDLDSTNGTTQRPTDRRSRPGSRRPSRSRRSSDRRPLTPTGGATTRGPMTRRVAAIDALHANRAASSGATPRRRSRNASVSLPRRSPQSRRSELARRHCSLDAQGAADVSGPPLLPRAGSASLGRGYLAVPYSGDPARAS